MKRGKGFHVAADHLGTRPFVDRERVGAIGMCAGLRSNNR